MIGYGLLKSGYHTLICFREVLSSIRGSRVAIVIEILNNKFPVYNNNNNNNIYLLQLGCYPVAVVILHVNKT